MNGCAETGGAYCLGKESARARGVVAMLAVLTAFVSGPGVCATAPDFGEQLALEFNVHVGDFDGNGFDDMLVHRTTAGVGDGTMPSYAAYQKAGGVDLKFPTGSALDNARGFPQAEWNAIPSVTPRDFNGDGYVDHMIGGIATTLDTDAVINPYILYAPGGSAGGAAANSVEVDENLAAFLHDIHLAARTRSFFEKSVTYVRYYQTWVNWWCPNGLDFPNGFGCYPEIWFTPHVGVVFHANLDALNVMRTFEIIGDQVLAEGGFTFAHMRILSDAARQVLGSPLFGLDDSNNLPPVSGWMFEWFPFFGDDLGEGGYDESHAGFARMWYWWMNITKIFPEDFVESTQ